MATKKINVRSPFYVEVNDQSPPSPTPPTPTATLYQWGGVINYSDTVGTLKTDLSSYTQAQLESEFICGECNGPSETSNKRSQYGYSQYKSNRLPMQVGDQVYDENGVALTVAATRGTIAYGIENGAVVETGINPCQKSTAILLGQPVYKQYLSHIYTWDSSGIVTAVKVPESNCELTNTIPQTPEQTLNCGETTTVGKDVGTRIFNIDARNRIGNFTITHTFSVPVRNIVVNRTSEAFPSIKVELRILMPLDDYGAALIATCAADTSRNAAPAISGTTGNLIEGSEAIIIEFYATDYYNISKAQGDSQWGLEILINGTIVKTIANGSLSWSTNPSVINIKSFVFTNITSAEYQVTPAINTFPAEQGYLKNKSPILVNSSSMKKGQNKIGFRFTTSNSNQYIKASQITVASTAIFYNSTAGTYKWADPYMHYKNGNYGLSDINTTPVRNFGSGSANLFAKGNQLNEIGYEIQKITLTEERHVPFNLKSPYHIVWSENEGVSEGATMLGVKYYTHNNTRQGQFLTFEGALFR